MAIEYVEWAKEGIESDGSYKKARHIAEKLRDFLDQEETEAEIRKADVPGAPSGKIQAIILPFAKKQGFENEAKGKFEDYKCKDLRPDYFHSEAGILLEVERGKTRMNNMDLLDIWKCHICEQARYLFLIIPKARRHKKKRPEKQFHLTNNRIATFFRKENYVNVDAVFLFGYGSYS